MIMIVESVSFESRLKGLLGCRIFRGVARHALNDLATHGKIEVFEPGDRIYAHDSAGDELFVVISGAIELRAGLATASSRLCVDLLRSGDVFGEVELLERRTEPNLEGGRCQEALAIEMSTVVRLDGPRVRRWMDRHRDIADRLTAILCGRYRRALALLGGVSFQPVEIRLAGHILDLAEVIGLDEGAAVRLRRRISHKQLGDALGITRRSVLNFLHLWASNGLVHQDRDGRLSILDRRRLVEISEVRPRDEWESEVGRWLAMIDAALAVGHNTRARDLAMETLERFPKNETIKHRAVMATARAGATRSALALCREFGLGVDARDEDVAALEPRLIKDLHLRESDPTRRAETALASATKYEAVYARTGGHYPAINAATMYRLAGRRDRSEELATAVLSGLGSTAAGYYPLASCAEASVLLGRPDEAATYLRRAAQARDGNPGTVATTRRQLRLIGIDESLIALLPQMKVGHYGIGAEVEDLAGRKAPSGRVPSVGVVFGGIASPQEIRFAEAAIEAEIELHVVLPSAGSWVRRHRIAPLGEDWVDRYDRCLEAAARVRVLTSPGQTDQPVSTRTMARYVKGMARLRAIELQTEVVRFGHPLTEDKNDDTEDARCVLFVESDDDVAVGRLVRAGGRPISRAPRIHRVECTMKGLSDEIATLRAVLGDGDWRIVCDVIDETCDERNANRGPDMSPPLRTIHASEMFAAEAALWKPETLTVDYVGRLPGREGRPPVTAYRIGSTSGDDGDFR